LLSSREESRQYEGAVQYFAMTAGIEAIEKVWQGDRTLDWECSLDSSLFSLQYWEKVAKKPVEAKDHQTA